MSTGSTGLGERRTTTERSPIRFLVFGLIVVLLTSILGVRLFMLQVANNVPRRNKSRRGPGDRLAPGGHL